MPMRTWWALVGARSKLRSCWRRDILRVKGQGLITNCNFLWLCVICNHRVVILDAPSSTHGVFTSFSLSKCCCFHFCRNKLGSCWRRDILRVKGQALITNCNFFYEFVWPICNHRVVITRCAIEYHGVFTSFHLSKCYCLHFWRNYVWAHVGTGIFRGSKL